MDMDRKTRRLRELCEPISSLVYFVPEANEEYATLGLGGSGASYFCSRGACLGRAPGEVIASAFGVFNPKVVVPLVTEGWSKTTPEAILGARYRGATAALRRVQPDGADPQRAVDILRPVLEDVGIGGRTLFAGLRSLPFPDEPIGQLWRVTDWVRERRGDTHIGAWISAGCDAVEIGLLTELYWRMPLGTYIKTRSWTQEDIDAGIARLEDKAHVKHGAFTDEGLKLRSGIEHATDRGEHDVIHGIGDRFDELCELLAPWAKAVLDAGAYPGGSRSFDDLVGGRQ